MKPSRAVPHGCRRQEASAWICSMASRMARRTCKLLVRAFDWCAPLLRKLRASEASFFFCHVQAAPCARLTMEPFFLSNFSSLRRVLVSFRGRTQLFRTGTHTHTFNIYIRVGIRIVLKAVRRIQLYYSWRWRGGPGGHDDGGGGRRRGGDTLWCNTCSGAEAHATSKTPAPARLVLRTSGTAAT